MTPYRVNAIYEELGTLIIELHPDPASLGPLYLQDLISKTRGYLNRVSLLLQEVSRAAMDQTRVLDAYETAYQASYDELLAEDEEVRNLPSIDDRKAKIALILKDDKSHISKAKRALKDIGFVEKAVKHRYKDLESTLSSIRMQKSLIEVDQRTGSFYGDENDASRGKGMADDFGDDSEIMRYLDEAVKDAEEKPQTAPSTVAEAVSSTPEEDEMEKFLKQPENSEHEFADLLGSI